MRQRERKENKMNTLRIVRRGTKIYPNRFWCACEICKSGAGACGVMVDRRSLKSDRNDPHHGVCSRCRRGDHT